MSKWRYEVKAAVHSVVHNVSSVQPTLIMEVSLKLIVNVLDDSLKTNRERTDRRKDIITSHNHVNLFFNAENNTIYKDGKSYISV